MGWLGTEHPEKPKARELNEMVDWGLSGPDVRIIDKSGWLGYDGRKFRYHKARRIQALIRRKIKCPRRLSGRLVSNFPTPT